MALLQNGERGPMFGISPEDQLKEFQRWIDAGRRPDEHRAVRNHKFSPNEDQFMRILGEVSLKKDYADQRWFSCNWCNHPGQFKDKGWCAAYSDGWWYFIGPDCGNERQQITRTDGARLFRKEQALDAAEVRVSRFMRSVPEWSVLWENVELAIRHLRQVQMMLIRSDVVKNTLLAAFRDQGKLYHVQTNHFGDIKSRELVGVLKGAEIGRRPMAVLSLHSKAKAALAQITGEQITEDDFAQQYSDARNRNKELLFASATTDAERKISELTNSVRELIEFFSSDNVKLLNSAMRKNFPSSNLKIKATETRLTLQEGAEIDLQYDLKELRSIVFLQPY
ncbi:MAG TPA: hypothetical protein EYN14_03870 [Alphaproteobacteria bacterium]|nr:hypothetical protein [Alphaproteobacteria bacterium]